MLKKEKNIVVGRKPILDALESGVNFEKILIDREMSGELEVTLRKKCKEKDIPLQRVPLPAIDKLTLTNHQGVAGFISPISYAPFDETVDQLIFEKGDPVFLILDQVKDVRNFGAIARTAEVFGVGALIVPAEAKAQINDVVIKTSAGAVLNIPVCRVSSLFTAIKTLKLHGVQIAATAMEGKAVHESRFEGPLGLVMGSEEKGIRPHLRRLCDQTVSIPQLGNTESLNVSVSVGIILYEINRQRGFVRKTQP
jgi:23S rRNA (guanosine2251-2'-O)-methyltransferase